MYKLAWFILLCNTIKAQEPLYDKVFFDNSPMVGNYFYSATSYTAPSWVENSNQKLPVSSQLFFTPGNSLVLTYVSAPKGVWQAKVLYHPLRGMDFFKPATQLVFRLFIKSNTSINELPSIAIAKDKEQISSFLPLQNFIPNYQKDQWLTVRIPLQNFKNWKDVNAINTILFQQQSSDSKEHHLYLDQIELLPTIASNTKAIPPPVITAKGYEKHVNIAWEKITDTTVKYIQVYRSADGKQFYPVGIQPPWFNRYADFTDTINHNFYYKISLLNADYKESAFSNIATAATHPMTDEQLLDMVQEASFRYYWEGAETNSGLALEDVPGRQHMIACGASGFGIMAIIAGTERGFITHQQAVERFERITSFLEKAEKFHGAFSHFMDGTTSKVIPFFGEKDNGGDLVETSFLIQGLLVAQQYFNKDNEAEKNIRNRIEQIWKGVEWDWYRKEKDSKFLYWHWSPDKAWVLNHKLIGYNETMITYILAIASPTHSIPASMYYTGFASQSEEAQKYRSDWGETTDGSHFTNGNTYYGIPLKVGVSDGGPLFFEHYSFMALDPHQMQDAYTNYFTNNQHIALINYRYCVENPGRHIGYGKDNWGLTASDGFWHYSANEPVAKKDEGKMTPTGALASFPYTPAESMAALKNYYRNYGKFLWGAYGFKDAFNLDSNWCSEIYMGLNQAPVVVMIENYRSGLIWKLFMKAADIQNGLKKLAATKPQ